MNFVSKCLHYLCGGGDDDDDGRIKKFLRYFRCVARFETGLEYSLLNDGFSLHSDEDSTG